MITADSSNAERRSMLQVLAYNRQFYLNFQHTNPDVEVIHRGASTEGGTSINTVQSETTIVSISSRRLERGSIEHSHPGC